MTTRPRRGCTKDAGLLAARAQARDGAIRKHLEAAGRARIAGQPDAALAELDVALTREATWRPTLSNATQILLVGELQVAEATLRSGIDQTLAAGAPLVARAQLGAIPVLKQDRLRLLALSLAAEIRQAGQDKCRRLEPTGEQPYWRDAVRRYCAEWEVTLAADAPPGLVRAVEVTGAVDGASGAEVDRFRSAVGEGVQRTGFWAAAAPDVGQATLTGAVTIAFTERPVTLEQSWTEQVPYTAYEDYQVAYQEPYTDSETYWEDVPYDDTEPYSYACGESVCTDSRTVTKYRSEQKVRDVTRYRTAYRTETRPVTQYQDVPRVFEYQATEYTGTYQATLSVTVAGIAVQVTRDQTRTGIQHDVTFAPAGVFPTAHGLPQPPAVMEDLASELAAEVARVLGARYTELHCTLPSYDLETASECAHGGAAAAPAAVHAAWRQALGDDEPAFAEVYDRRR